MNSLDYLRNSLEDSERMGAQPTEKNSYALPFSSLKEGVIGADTTERLFKKHENLRRHNKKEAQREGKNKEKIKEEVNWIDVCIFPLKYSRRVEHGGIFRSNPSRFDFLYPLCLPAVLSKKGKLSGKENLSPFISRLYLSPQSMQSSYPEITSVSKHDDFLAKNNSSFSSLTSEVENHFNHRGWSQYWSYAEELWKHLSNTELRKLEIEGYVLAKDGAILIPKDAFSSRYLLELYDTLREKKPSTPLLTKFLAETNKKEKDILRVDNTSLLNEKLLAQMNQDRPLSQSQHEVMNYFLDNPKNLFLTVNGPPGTGKTTLIQSLVANIWVKAALDQSEPPIIVATSTNNNAVTNVLDSFKTENSSADLLSKRWLPHIHSFGAYCASASNLGNVKQGWMATKYGGTMASYATLGDDPKEIENNEYFSEAQTEFKQNFEKMFQKKLNKTSDIIAFLHTELSLVAKDITLGIDYQKKLLIPFDKPLAEKKAAAAEDIIRLWRQKRQSFKLLAKDLPFYIKWARDIPVLRKVFGQAEEKRLKEFFLHESIRETPQDFYCESVEGFIAKRINESQENLKEIFNSLRDRENLEEQWEKWRLKHNLACAGEGPLSALALSALRSRLFYMAAHYWEARWLQDRERDIKQKDKTRANSKEEWLRRAKLSPCFVTTFYMLPRFFSSNDSSYLYNFIDYLIADEAGQASTYIAAPSFALAKKAIILGDTKQLEPILSIPEVIDKGNCKKFDLIKTEKEYEEFKRTGLAASHSSLMNRAHYLCDFKQDEDLDDAGFILREHWRCVPEIASYCNELAYNGRLEPQRESLADPLFPALGYAHIPGQSEQKGESRYNQLEAWVIGDWLKENADRIRQRYDNKPLREIIGIITPFKAQADLLKNEFKKLNLPKDITIGTLHSLQGAERPLIIFSPAYGANDPTNFVDKNVNFFNVALSRAKDSFLVFGNMDQFKASGAAPSSLLARRLFADENNEIGNIKLGKFQKIEAELTEEITSLERHRELLIQGIQQAKEKLLIVSPFISINAINADNIALLIKDAVKRKVQVIIITDKDYNADWKKNKRNSEKGKKELDATGALFYVHPRIHAKILCVDEHTHISGSFNWLSASRDPKWAKIDNSDLFKGGENVQTRILRNWTLIEGLKPS